MAYQEWTREVVQNIDPLSYLTKSPVDENNFINYHLLIKPSNPHRNSRPTSVRETALLRKNIKNHQR